MSECQRGGHDQRRQHVDEVTVGDETDGERRHRRHQRSTRQQGPTPFASPNDHDRTDHGGDEQQRRAGRERRRRGDRFHRVRTTIDSGRPEPDERPQALNSERVRAQVVHHRGRQESEAEEAAMVAGEPRRTPGVDDREDLLVRREAEQRTEAPVVDRDMAEQTRRGDRQHDPRRAEMFAPGRARPPAPEAHHDDHAGQTDADADGYAGERRRRDAEPAPPRMTRTRRLVDQANHADERPRRKRRGPQLGLVVHADPTRERQRRRHGHRQHRGDRAPGARGPRAHQVECARTEQAIRDDQRHAAHPIEEHATEQRERQSSEGKERSVVEVRVAAHVESLDAGDVATNPQVQSQQRPRLLVVEVRAGTSMVEQRERIAVARDQPKDHDRRHDAATRRARRGVSEPSGAPHREPR